MTQNKALLKGRLINKNYTKNGKIMVKTSKTFQLRKMSPFENHLKTGRIKYIDYVLSIMHLILDRFNRNIPVGHRGYSRKFSYQRRVA